MKPCNHPQCRNLVGVRVRYCDEHEPQHRKALDESYDRLRRSKDDKLSLAARIRSSPRWKRVRAIKLSESPMCADLFMVHAKRKQTVTASQVHHVVSLQAAPHLAYELSNLMSVCPRCHARLSQDERRIDCEAV